MPENQSPIPRFTCKFTGNLLMDIRQILQKYWGFTSFRPLQEEIIQSILDGKDTLALLPTGGGKSICFQLPAMKNDGICVVISPLIALMKDQVYNLRKRNINACAVISGMSKREIDYALDNCVHGDVKFLYVSPERLETEIFIERFKKMKVNLIAVDEAHCISQWGYDFRPPYLRISAIREFHPTVPVLALTATATSSVVKDIQEKLLFKKENLFQQSFERKNISLVVLNEESKLKKLQEIVEKVKGCGIIYVRNRKKTQEIAEYLMTKKVKANYYHAGLDIVTRTKRQEDWMKNKSQVIVCTNAFGMGIDKPDVRFVIHYDLPDSLEAYYQEAGRAGRDGKKSYAVILFNYSDKIELEKALKENFPSVDEVKRVYDALGNFFNLAIGSGQNEEFDFDIVAFCKNFKLNPIRTFTAFKILEQEGWLVSNDAVFLPSRIKVLADKDELYRFEVANQAHEDLIRFILRSYSGVLDHYSKFREQDAANHLGISVDEVKSKMNFLKQSKLLDYEQSTDQPTISLLHSRVSAKDLNLDVKMIQFRKQSHETRIRSMLSYAGNKLECRNRILLNYFGEDTKVRCGYCDVCLKRNNLSLSDMEFEKLVDEIETILIESPLSIEILVDAIKNYKNEKTLQAIEWLVDNGSIRHNEKNQLVWAQ